MSEAPDHDPVEISGQLSARDLKRLKRLARSGSIGPTTVYYAGLTAPFVVSSIALVTASALRNAGMGGMGQQILAGLIAALTGICWYLIFMRWADNRELSRTIEQQGGVSLRANEEGLELYRGHALIRIAWPGVRGIRETRQYVLLQADGAGYVLVPGKWFKGDIAARQAFTDYIRARVQA